MDKYGNKTCASALLNDVSVHVLYLTGLSGVRITRFHCTRLATTKWNLILERQTCSNNQTIVVVSNAQAVVDIYEVEYVYMG